MSNVDRKRAHTGSHSGPRTSTGGEAQPDTSCAVRAETGALLTDGRGGGPQLEIEQVQQRVSAATYPELHGLRRQAERRQRMYGLGWHDEHVLAECDLELDAIATEFRCRAADAKVRNVA